MSKKVLNTVTTTYIRTSAKFKTELRMITKTAEDAINLVQSWDRQGRKDYDYEIVEQINTPIENAPLLENMIGEGSNAHWKIKEYATL